MFAVRYRIGNSDRNMLYLLKNSVEYFLAVRGDSGQSAHALFTTIRVKILATLNVEQFAQLSVFIK